MKKETANAIAGAIAAIFGLGIVLVFWAAFIYVSVKAYMFAIGQG